MTTGTQGGAANMAFDETEYRERLIAAGLSEHDATTTAAMTAAAHHARENPTKEGLIAGRMTDRAAPPRQGRAKSSHLFAALAPDLFEVSAEQPQAAPTPSADAQAPSPAAPSSTQSKKATRKAVTPILRPIEGTLSQRQRQLIEDAAEIEKEDAKKAGAIGYMARALAQATLPYTDPKIPLGQLYSRDTGKLTLTVAPTSKKHGIPFGVVPRMILAWICTELCLTEDRTLSLGHSQSDFLKKIGMHNNGRDIERFKDQALRLFKSVISVEYADSTSGDESARLLISSQSHVFWHPKCSDQKALWESSLELSEDFAREVLANKVPIDMRVFHALSRSPLSMDIYTWLTYRMFVIDKLGHPFARIPWVGLKMQFGANFPDTQQGLYDFKTNFKKRLREVLNFYPEARDSLEDEKKIGCLKLWPAPLHIPHLKRAV